MLGRLGVWRHVLMAVVVLVCAGLALFGVVGGRPEKFEARQFTIEPAGEDGVRIREVVDDDFGSEDRHGYERTIPNDFGVPTEVTASSPDAPDDLTIEQIEGDITRLRIGDSDTTLNGQHRYVLTYTLPAARISTGMLALDVIGTDQTLQTDRFEVVVSGMELANTKCNAGENGAKGGCDLVQDGDVYRAVVAPLEAGEGITIGGEIVRTFAPDEVPIPPLPPRKSDVHVVLALVILVLGSAVSVLVYWWSRRTGRNEVFAGGAAEAAYGTLPAPAPDGSVPKVQTVLVADEKMDELATVEFVPPKGVEPWEGAVLLKERIDQDTVAAWFSGLAAHDVITFEKDHDDKLVMSAGPKYETADTATRAHLDHVLGADGRLTLGKYDKKFTETWGKVRRGQEERIRASGWWKRFGPRSGCAGQVPRALLVFLMIFSFVFLGSFVVAILGALGNVWVSIVMFGLVIPGVFALGVYAVLRSARSATGSALALRTESFRRFLASSEGRHVEWAWQHGLLREYSAWAVALDAADAWEDALKASNVPQEAQANFTTPLLVHSMASSFRSSATPPSSSGGSGGGFSGGSVGGGGGGGGSGNW